jgi:multidrug efflux pump subunit AcrA (membrane-fusion protein)
MVAPGAIALLLVIGGAANLAVGSRGYLVDTTRPERRDLLAEVSLDAVLAPRRTFVARSAAVGRVAEVAVRRGERVEAGRLLLRLDDIEASAELEAARAALGGIDADGRAAAARHVRSQTRLTLAARDRARAGALWRAGLLSRTDREAAETACQLAGEDTKLAALHVTEQQQRADRQRHIVAGLEHALEALRIRSPMAGIVADVLVAPGDAVVPSAHTGPAGALLVVHDDTVPDAVAHVTAGMLPSVVAGQPAWLSLAAFPGERIAGTLRAVAVAPVDHSTLPGTTEPRYRVVVRLDTDLPVRTGQTGIVSIVTAERRNVPSIPRHVVTRDPATTRPAVFVVDGGRAILAPVDLGVASAHHVELLGGVPDGVTLIAGPLETARQLKPGDRVTVRR